jgi:hypothetical protein
MASGSGASRVGPSGPGRGGAAGGAAIGARGRGRFISGGGSSGIDNDGGIGGGSRLVEQWTAVKREEQLQAHDQVLLLVYCT